MTPRILITGAGGQLGRALLNTSVNGAEVLGLDRRACNIEDPQSIASAFDSYKPDAVVNAAAYANVDQAESESERAFSINRDGVRNLAVAAGNAGARLVHVSTDYVFDGSQRAPYATDAKPNPLSVYGKSKLAGEQAIIDSRADWVVVRSAWIFSSDGTNFVPTVLGKIASGENLRFVSDQTGTPTFAVDLAGVLLRIALDRSLRGVFHWTNDGSGSRYDEAVALQEIALKHRLVDRPVTIAPIKTGEFPAAARRPPYSVLDSSALWKLYGKPSDWRSALERALTALLIRRRRDTA